MKRFFSFLFVALFAVSCGSKNSPTSSSSFNWNGPIVLSAVGNGLVFTEIATQSGPVSTAAVTLSYLGGAAALPYQYNVSIPVTYSGGVTALNVAYYLNSSFTYTAGQPYTLTADFGGNTYSASTTAVSSPVFSTTGSGLVATWVGGGNANVITAEDMQSPYTTKTFGPNVTSPCTILNSALPGSSGNNDVIASINDLNPSAFSGTSNGSYLLSAGEAVTVGY